MTMKRFKKGELPEVNENGFFQLFSDIKIKGNEYHAGAWFKVLNISPSGKMWTVRPKYHRDSTAVEVRSAIFAKQRSQFYGN